MIAEGVKEKLEVPFGHSDYLEGELQGQIETPPF